MSNRTPQDIASDVLAKIPGTHKKSGNSYSFKCPAHDDRQASAAIYVKQDSVAFKCFVGCSTDEFCAAIGITKADLQAGHSTGGTGVQIAYPYTDAKGNLLCEHLRMKPGARARFFWRRYDQHGRKAWTLNAGWFDPQGQHLKRLDLTRHDPANPPQAGAVWLDAAPRALYRLPKLKAAIAGTLVIWNEGEKDVHTAEDWGLLSTTAGGAKDWRTEYADDLAGLDLVIIADNDAAGRVHAGAVARDCHGKAARVRLIERLPGVKDKGDLTDWKAMGHTRDELLALIAATPDYVPVGDAIEDESTAVDVEPDDAAISGDPKIEKYLRQIARNAAKVNDAVDLIVRKLGFQGDHSRLLVKLGSIAPHLLGTISCKHEWLAQKYGMSVSTVARDIQKLMDEQKRIGVELVSYTQGTYNPQTGVGYASKFRRCYLRWALEAISVAIETRGDLEYSHDALNRACGEVAKRVPRLPVEETAKVEADASDRAEKRADGEPNLDVLKAKHKLKATVTLKRLLQSMSDDGLTIEDAELVLSDAFNDATDAARERLEKSQPADHIEAVRIQSVTTIHDGQQNGSDDTGPSVAYGLQNDDHRLPDNNPTNDTEIHDSPSFPLATEDYYAQDQAAADALINSQCEMAEAMLAADAVPTPGVAVSLTGIEHTPEQKAAFRRRDLRENFDCQWVALEHNSKPFQKLWPVPPDELDLREEYARILAAMAAHDGKPNDWRGWAVWKSTDGAYIPTYLVGWLQEAGLELHAHGVAYNGGPVAVPLSRLDFSPQALADSGLPANHPAPDLRAVPVANVLSMAEHKTKPKPPDIRTVCDFCDAKLEWGAACCPGCGACTKFRWRGEPVIAGSG